MNSNVLRLAVAQLTSTDHIADNLQVVCGLVQKAAAAGADLIVFPENTLYLRIRSGSKVESLRLDGGVLGPLVELVNSTRMSVLLTTPVDSGGEKVLNSTIFIEPGVAPRVVYSKIHMFDVDVVGAPPVRESDHFLSGNKPEVLDFRGWKIGLSICYDLRFAELFLHYAQTADVILIPSAFLVPTGQAHWHVLIRARAIECQAYVVAPAQSGEHRSGDGDKSRSTYGHSLAIDPWGKVLTELETSPEVRVVDLTRENIQKARAQIPMALHRRLKPI